jgi:hypothetical protein
MALKQASKRIKFSDESINSKQFWVLNDGIDVSVFLTNPILLFNHVRADKNDKNQILPIGCMLELKREPDGSWSGLPAFDDTDAFALSIYEKYEAGIINMASSGLKPIEVLGEGKFLKLKDGIKAPCLSKCALKEISLVDIASNDNAIKLYNNDELIDITTAEELLKLFIDSPKNKNTNMELKDLLPLLTLADTATFTDVADAIKKQNEVVIQLKADNKIATDALAAITNANAQAKVVKLIDDAITDKKIAPADKDGYLKLATADFETTEAVIKNMKPYESIEKKLNDSSAVNQVELSQLILLSGNVLFDQGKLDRLKELSPAHYKLKYEEAFGKAPEEKH